MPTATERLPPAKLCPENCRSVGKVVRTIGQATMRRWVDRRELLVARTGQKQQD